MSEKTAIIFIGIQASGKSTFYHEQFAGYVHINLDTLHTRNKEKLLLQECVESGYSFVVDNTNPTKADREKYIRAAKDYGYRILLSGKLKTGAFVKLKQCGKKYTVGIPSNYCLCILHIGRNSRPPMRIKT